MALFVVNASKMFLVIARLAGSIFAWTVSMRNVLINRLRNVENAIIGFVWIVCMKAGLIHVMESAVTMGRIYGGEVNDYRGVARVV